MASKNYFKKLKEKLITILTVVCLFSFSMFALIGCKDEETKSYEDGIYSISTEENDDGLISNANFSFEDDFNGIENEDYPLTSPTGWTKSVDSAPSSAVDSGVVDVTKESWNAYLSKLYDDSDFSKYLENKNPNDEVSKEDFVNGTKNEEYQTPGTHEGASDNYVYVLNNYLSSVDYGLGTAQKVTSASTVTLEKGATYKLSVWVKTINVFSFNDAAQGATIRLSNNFNSTLQAEYRLTNIIAEDWTQYSLYITTDKDYKASFTLSLGLGLGNKTSTNAEYFSEGTALFDDITFEEVTSIPAGITTSNLLYGSTDVINQSAVGKTSFCYDLSLEKKSFENLNKGNIDTASIPEGKLTQSEIEYEGKKIDSTFFDATSTATMTGPDDDGVRKVTLKNSSYTIEIQNNDFSLNGNEYLYFVFYVKSDLNVLAHKSVTVDILDKYNGTEVNRASVASYTQEKVGELTKLGLLIKNNFDTKRDFDIKIIFGPSNIADIKYTSEFATGTVEFKDITWIKGSLDAETYDDGADNPAYKLIKLFENSGSVTSLYAGYSEDYKDSDNKTIEYAIKSAPGNMGEIVSGPTNAIGFIGVTSNHSYVKKQDGNEVLETEINTRTGNGNAMGVAGLINSNPEYPYVEDLKDELALNDEDDPIQVLMINNKQADSYGYITPSKTLTANALAKASVTLRVVGDAKAYVYLVNTINEEKEVMEFTTFTVNTDIVKGVENGKTISGNDNKFELVVNKDMMDADGWVTVEFYLQAGEKDKQFRLEIWNGSRDGENKSQGFVFIKEAQIDITDSAFTIPSRWADSFSDPSSPLFGASRENLTLYAYQQELNENEIAYNKEYPDEAISYNPQYVWAKNETRIFASFAPIECAENNPYDAITEEEEEESGCAAKTDPSTFWLSFSSILLGVVLLLAILVLFIKNIRRKRKYYGKRSKNDYKVQSRITTHKNNQKKLQELAKQSSQLEDDTDIEDSDIAEEFEEIDEIIPQDEEIETEENIEDKVLDDYVYGDVQDFGETPEESNDEE